MLNVKTERLFKILLKILYVFIFHYYKIVYPSDSLDLRSYGQLLSLFI